MNLFHQKHQPSLVGRCHKALSCLHATVAYLVGGWCLFPPLQGYCVSAGAKGSFPLFPLSYTLLYCYIKLLVIKLRLPTTTSLQQVRSFFLLVSSLICEISEETLGQGTLKSM